MEMSEIIKALTVPFAAGFVVQRVVEILDTYTTAKFASSDNKKFIVGVFSVGLGCVLAGCGQIRIFQLLGWNMNWFLDYAATGIFISGGSEGFNSLLKFANYKKEASKADAANKIERAPVQAVKSLNPGGSKIPDVAQVQQPGRAAA